MPQTRPPIDRFTEKVKINEDGCWIWMARRNAYGYGTFNDGAGNRSALAHRWSYCHFVGEIPKGLELDHLCRVRECVNPGHLEPVTHAENILRGNSPAAQNKRKTHCDNGHEFTPENTLRVSGGNRACKSCTRTWINDYKREKRAAERLARVAG